MATPEPDDEFDWKAAEADIIDLGNARQKRRPENWSADIDDEHDKIGDDLVLVDPADLYTAPVLNRRPIIPAWLRSKPEAVAAVRWHINYGLYVSIYHLARLPLYAARLTYRAPRGVARAVAGTSRWMSDAEGRPVRLAAVRREDAADYLRLSRQRDGRVRLRTLILLTTLMLSLFVAAVLLIAAPRWAWYAATVAIVGVLGFIGSSADRPLMEPAAVKPRVRKLTADVLMRAFLAAGLCKADKPITFPSPIMRDGPGWRAVIDLPFGTKADTAIKKRNDLAAGLDLDEVQVWPERVRRTAGSARRLALWVADEDPYAKSSGLWPLIAKGQVDIFEPFPFGEDQRGRTVLLQLIFTSLLIGAIPRMGKTFAARLPALACALDPIVELHIYDGKGGQDWRSFERIAHRVGFGVRDEVVLGLVEDLRALVEDMNRRYDTIATLPADICPESKVTRAIAERRSLKLWPVLVSIDEFQRYSGHVIYGDEIVSLLTELGKVGPSVGIMLALATQKPDGKAVPTDLRDNIGTRFALKTMTWQSSEAVLGAGSYTAGYDSSRLQRAHKGVGILLGADDSDAVEEAVTVRTNRVPMADVDSVITRARALRESAGTLTGYAAGELPRADSSAVSLLDDILTVVPINEPKVWSETVAARLAELRPEAYGGWKPEQVATALKPYGITVGRQVWGTDPVTREKANRKGIHREDIAAAVAERDRRRRAA
ncbi:cell division protein FtsK [Actinoplanes sp. TFC3]|uniref:cell division protein FtsK n=1 Tax=Actinoplanes sp. TFC3 TaxID=1710355 RepID=UPI00082A8458|nr:cell division protein FtsK [Actinoplanes sp. TFC3]